MRTPTFTRLVVPSLLAFTTYAASASAQGTAPQKPPKEVEAIKVPFGFNDDTLSVEYRDQLQKLGRCMKAQPDIRLTIGGHADERGSTEFNLALGERRAVTVRKYLESLGVPPERLRTVSYGEEKPLDDGKDEAAWAANRRAEFAIAGTWVTSSEAAAACFADANGGASADDEAARRKAEEDAAAARKKAEEEAEARRRAEEEARRRAEEEARRRAEAEKDKGGMVDGWFYKRMFPWLPVWVGPVVMVAALPAFVFTIPFIISMVYLGPSVFSAPNACQEPVAYNNGSPEVNSGGAPNNWCGSIWSVAQHEAERPLAGTMLAIGALGTAVFGLVGTLLLATGAGLFIAALLPGNKEETVVQRDPPAAAQPAEAPAGDAVKN